MERESFEDEDIAAAHERDFVCVKVDREERPDLDDIYMAATLAMNQGQGGWPMTVFLTPEQEPFFAGHLLPARRPLRPAGLPDPARADRGACGRRDRAGLRAQAAELVELPARRARARAPGGVRGRGGAARARRASSPRLRRALGGFGGAPKFPPSAALCSCSCAATAASATSGRWRWSRKTLDEMARGRHVRPARRRLPPLLRGRALAGAALREDAVRQRAARRVVPRGLPGHGRPVLRADRPRDPRLRAARDDLARGRLLLRHRRRLRGRGGQVLRLDARARSRRRWATRRRPGGSARTTTSPSAATGRARASPTRRAPGPRGREVPGRGRRGARGATWPPLRAAALRGAPERVPPGPRRQGAHGLERAHDRRAGRGRARAGRRRVPRGRASARPTSCSTPCATATARLLRTWRAGTRAPRRATSRTTRTWPRRCSTSTRPAATALLREAARAGRAHRARTSRRRGRRVLLHRQRPRGADRPPSGGPRRRHSQPPTPRPRCVLARLSFHLDRADLREEAGGALRAYGKAIARQPRAFARSLIAVDLLLEGPVELAFVGTPARRTCEALRREAGRALPAQPHRRPWRSGRGEPAPAPGGQGARGRPGRALRLPRLRLPGAGHRPGRGRGAALARGRARGTGRSLGPERPPSGDATEDGTAAYAARIGPRQPRRATGLWARPGLIVQPRRLRRLPRGRRDAGAPRGAARRCARAATSSTPRPTTPTAGASA